MNIDRTTNDVLVFKYRGHAAARHAALGEGEQATEERRRDEEETRARRTDAWINDNGIFAWYRVMMSFGGDGRDFFTRLHLV